MAQGFLFGEKVMPTEKKQELVAEIKERFSRSTITVATDYISLSANDMTELRRRLREQGIEYRVVKNTLTWIAADEAGKPEAKSIVQGPTALAFGYGDPTQVAKTLDEYIRATRSSLTIRGAEMDGRVLSSDDIDALVSLPSKEQLLAQLLGQLQAPIANLVGVLNSPLSGLVGALNSPLNGLTGLLQARAQQMGGS
jgi:large subunit ribosomal protein L10